LRQSQMIGVINFDDRLMTGKKIHKHGNMLPNSTCGIICVPSNCDKTNVLISLLGNSYGARFENVYVYSRSFQ